MKLLRHHRLWVLVCSTVLLAINVLIEFDSHRPTEAVSRPLIATSKPAETSRGDTNHVTPSPRAETAANLVAWQTYGARWHSPHPAEELEAFHRWTDRLVAQPRLLGSEDFVDEGIQLASDRQSAFLNLIKSDPALAISFTIPNAVRRLLPSAVAEKLENRIHGIGDFSVTVPCALPAPVHVHAHALPIRSAALANRLYTAHTYGRRTTQATKQGLFIHGVALGHELALHESPLRLVESDELPQTTADENKHARSPSLIVEALGRRWVLANGSESLTQFEQRLIAAESMAGPQPQLIDPQGVDDTRSRAAAAATPWTTGEKKVLVIRVDFSDVPGDPRSTFFPTPTVTAQSGQDWMNTKVAPFFQAMSYGKVTITPTVTTKLYRMPASGQTYATMAGGTTQLMADARAAAAADFTSANYDRVAVVFSSLAGFTGSRFTGFVGLGQLGGTDIWINGAFWAIAHELGHTFGLPHANLWLTKDGNPFSAAGVSIESNDAFDIMGGAEIEDTRCHFNPYAKNRLGWMEDTQVREVTGDGTYRLTRHDHGQSSGTLALKIARGSTRFAWVSARRAITDNASLFNGLQVHWSQNNSTVSHVLDLEAPGNMLNPTSVALQVGKIVCDIEGNMTIKAVARGGTAPNEWIDVQIVFGPVAPYINTPPANVATFAGQATSFSLEADGNPKPAYQWQRQAAGDATWSDLSDGTVFGGTTTPTLIINTAAAGMAGDRFRSTATNSQGSTISPAAQLSIPASGVITLVGRAGQPGPVDGIGASARLYWPSGLTLLPDGTLYVADNANHRIRRVSSSGVVSILAGSTQGSVDGTGAGAQFNQPTGIAADSDGNIYVVSFRTSTVRRITPAGVVTTFAGSTMSGSTDGPLTAARFFRPTGIAVGPTGAIYVADQSNHTIRKIENGMVSTLAGKAGEAGTTNGVGTAARFNLPRTLTVDRSGNVYVTEPSLAGIRKVTPGGIVSTFVTSSLMRAPHGLAFDQDGNLFVTDSSLHTVLKVTPAGQVSSVAGVSGRGGSADGPASTATFFGPEAIAVASDGSIYVADTDSSTIRKIVPSRGPVVTAQPAPATVVAGAATTLSVVAADASGATYQWSKNGVPIPGATLSTYTLANVNIGDAGDYAATITTSSGATISAAARITVDFSRIVNLSILTNLTATEGSFTVGTVIGGIETAGAKPVLFRAVGPSLAALGVTSALADPSLDVFSGPNPTASNNDWAGASALNAAFMSVGAFNYASTTSKDSAVFLDGVAAGNYTVRVQGAAGTGGTVLAEIYDALPPANALSGNTRLINVSVLKAIPAGEILTAGFVIAGNAPKLVLIRAVGPTLAAEPFNIPGALSDPQLQLYSGSSLINANDNWGGGSTLTSAFNRVGAFALPSTSRDAALLLSLAPGNYTVQVRGVGASAGLAIVEIYEVP